MGALLGVVNLLPYAAEAQSLWLEVSYVLPTYELKIYLKILE